MKKELVFRRLFNDLKVGDIVFVKSRNAKAKIRSIDNYDSPFDYCLLTKRRLHKNYIFRARKEDLELI